MRSSIFCLPASLVMGVVALAMVGMPSSTALAQYTPTSSHDRVDLGKLVCTGTDFPRGEYREGWVDFRFKVLPDGKLTDIDVVTVAGSGRLIESALRNLSTCRYSQPPTENGQPVAMANVYKRYTISQSPSRAGVGVKEKTELGRQMLSQGRLDDASAALDMAEQTASRKTEWNDIILLRSALMGLRGRDDIALRYLQQLPIAEMETDDAGDRARLLRMRQGLELKLGLLASAERSARDLATAKPQADDAGMLAALEKLRQLGASGQPMAVKGRVPAECRPVICDPGRPSWEYVPTHRTLSLADPTGRLDNVTFRCARKTFATPATIGTTWTIPASFGACAVEVTGEPGASFTLIDETVPG